jgi:DNA-directed RNA polymerase specialized sigma24 family protein
MDMGDDDLESLAARYAAGDRTCEGRLYEAVIAFARQWVRPRMNHPRHYCNVDHVVNGIAASALRSIAHGAIHEICKLKGWLKKTCISAVGSYYRTEDRSVRDSRPVSLDAIGAEPQDTHESDAQRLIEVHKLVQTAIDSLCGNEKKIAIGIMWSWDTEKMLEETSLTRATYFRRRKELLNRLKRILMRLLSFILAILPSTFR